MPTVDDTRSRWPVDPRWSAVQRASLAGTTMPASRIKAGQASGSLRKLMPQLVRCLTSAAAILGVDEVHDTFRALVPHIATFEQQAGTSFSDRVAEKRART